MSGRVAVVGTGTMGRPIAERLAERGHRVTVWNRTAARAEFGQPGVQACRRVADCVRGATHVLLVLADDAALTEVLLGAEHRLVDELVAGQVVLALGTVRPETVRSLAGPVTGRGAALLDVGMLGNGRHARGGELRLYAGGEQAELAVAQPVLADIGKEIRYVGELGAGMGVKLALNLLMGLQMQALAEVGALAEARGLDRGTVLEIATGSGFGSPVMAFKSRRMAGRRYQEPDFRLALMTKDLGLARQAAAAGGRDLPMTTAAYESHEAACAAGLGDLDCAAIADALPARRPAEVGS